MRTRIWWLALPCCGGAAPEPFGLAPPSAGLQVHAGGPEAPPGERCLPVALPEDAWLRGFELRARPGLRGATLLLAHDAPDGERACATFPDVTADDPGRPATVAYRSPAGAADDAWDYPDGGSLHVPPGRRAVLAYRFDDAPEGAELFLNVRVDPRGAELWPFSLAVSQFSVLPGMSRTEQTTCTPARDLTLYLVAPHLGPRAARLALSGPGGTILAAEDWDEPAAVRAPPAIALAAGAPVTLACTWQNSGDAPIDQDDEPCRVSGVLAGTPGPLLGTTDTIGGVEVCELAEEQVRD